MLTCLNLLFLLFTLPAEVYGAVSDRWPDELSDILLAARIYYFVITTRGSDGVPAVFINNLILKE